MGQCTITLKVTADDAAEFAAWGAYFDAMGYTQDAAQASPTDEFVKRIEDEAGREITIEFLEAQPVATPEPEPPQ